MPSVTLSGTSMKAGPKAAKTAEPLDLSGLPPKRDYRRVVAFIERFCIATKGTGAGEPFKVHPFQRDILRSLFPASGKAPRQGLTLIPRGNGKSSLAAAVAVWALFDGGESAQVLCVAVDLRQAAIVFGMACRMIELHPDLAARTKLYSDRAVYVATASQLFPVPAKEDALQGFDPSLAIVDEAAFLTPEAIESVMGASGKRASSLVWMVSTPPMADDNYLFDLLQDSKESPRSDFAVTVYTSDKSHSKDCSHCWKLANPALGKFLHRDGLAADMRSAREQSFRRLRLGQFVSGSEDAWIEPEQFDAQVIDRKIEPGSPVVIGFDGSYSGDHTVIVAVTVEKVPHVDLLAIWKPAEHGGKVPIAQVEQALRQACADYQVTELVADPYRWQRSLQVLEGENLPVVEFPQSRARMEPATLALREAIIDGNVTFSADPDLRAHTLNAVVTDAEDTGTRLRKVSKHSEKRIDAIVAAVMAHSRATYHANKIKPAGKATSWRYS